MTIAKKPKSTPLTSASQEEQAVAFISAAAPTPLREKKQSTGKKKTPIMMRFAPEVLERVDEAAKRRGISRSAWIQYVVSRAIDQGEG